MKRITSFILTVLMLISTAISVSAEAETEDVVVMLTVDATRQVINGELIIDDKYFSQYNIKVKQVSNSLNNKYEYFFTVDAQDAKNIVKALREDENFGFVNIDDGDGDSISDNELLHLSSDGNYTYKTVSAFGADGIWGCNLIEYIGEKELPSNYTLPLFIDGLDVQYVSKEAFKNINTIKTLNIKRSTTLKSRAFYNCRNLKTVNSKMNTSFDSDAVGYYKGNAIKGFKVIINTDENWKGTLAKKSDNDSVYFADQNGYDCVLNIKTSDNFALNFEKAGISFKAKVNGKSTTDWKSSDTKVVAVTKNGKITLKTKGEALLTTKLNNGKTYKRWINVSPSLKTINLDNNPITVKVKAVKASAKKTKSFAKSKYLTIKNAKGKLAFKKKSGNKRITVNSRTGKLTVKKGLKKGRTYSIKLLLKAKGNANFKSSTRSLTIKIKIK